MIQQLRDRHARAVYVLGQPLGHCVVHRQPLRFRKATDDDDRQRLGDRRDIGGRRGRERNAQLVVRETERPFDQHSISSRYQQRAGKLMRRQRRHVRLDASNELGIVDTMSALARQRDR